jgi:hypothetical protein
MILLHNMNSVKEFYNNTHCIIKRMHFCVIEIKINFDEFKDKYIILSHILCNLKKLDFEFIFI